jgi:hypothetical protein
MMMMMILHNCTQQFAWPKQLRSLKKGGPEHSCCSMMTFHTQQTLHAISCIIFLYSCLSNKTYNPHLASWTFFLFPIMNVCLQLNWFTNPEEVVEAWRTMKWIIPLLPEFKQKNGMLLRKRGWTEYTQAV